MKMIIKYLETGCAKMDRLISLQAAIDVVTKHYRAFDNDLLELIVYEMKRLPSAQPELAQNLHNACTDLISRKEVIKLLDEAWVDGHEYQGWLHDEVNRLPSAQPNLQPTCNNLATDTISRQAAIDAILAVTGNSSVRELYEHVQEHGLSDMWSGGVSAAIDVIIAVPSAQPEHFADVGNMDDGELDFVQKHEKIPAELRVSKQLDRDIPKKPNEVIDKAWGIPNRQAVCPNCDSYLGTIHFICGGDKRKISYCESCGQAIDWKGWEEDD